MCVFSGVTRGERGRGRTTPGDTIQGGDTRMKKKLWLNLLAKEYCRIDVGRWETAGKKDNN